MSFYAWNVTLDHYCVLISVILSPGYPNTFTNHLARFNIHLSIFHLYLPVTNMRPKCINNNIITAGIYNRETFVVHIFNPRVFYVALNL